MLSLKALFFKCFACLYDISTATECFLFLMLKYKNNSSSDRKGINRWITMTTFSTTDKTISLSRLRIPNSISLNISSRINSRSISNRFTNSLRTSRLLISSRFTSSLYTNNRYISSRYISSRPLPRSL